MDKDYYKKLEKKKERTIFWGDILGGLFIIISIITGTAPVVAPLILVIYFIMAFSRKI